jgi:hypothetical protein
MKRSNIIEDQLALGFWHKNGSSILSGNNECEHPVQAIERTADKSQRPPGPNRALNRRQPTPEKQTGNKNNSGIAVVLQHEPCRRTHHHNLRQCAYRFRKCQNNLGPSYHTVLSRSDGFSISIDEVRRAVLHAHRANNADIFQRHYKAGMASRLCEVCLFVQFPCHKLVEHRQKQ